MESLMKMALNTNLINAPFIKRLNVTLFHPNDVQGFPTSLIATGLLNQMPCRNKHLS